jgi:hypothetical protein
MPRKTSGQAPFKFSYCEDLHTLPVKAQSCEVNLHGGFAVDRETGGHIYYGMPGCGLMRISPDLTAQHVIELPSDLKPINFHSTKICTFDGKRRLVMAANGDAKVVVLSLEGQVDFVLARPEFEEYQNKETPFNPTDTAIVHNHVYVADGYGANYISRASLSTGKWTGIFGGKTGDPNEPGKFGTAHGLNPTPDGRHLSIADRPHARFELFSHDGHFHSAHSIPAGSKPCGIDFLEWKGRHYALVGSLDDPQPVRPAPIYVLDAETYDVVSTIRPKEELGVALADHIHNTIWYPYNGGLYLICQAWNPGYYFVLELVNG